MTNETAYMPLDEQGLEAAYSASRDYLMELDDRTKQMLRVSIHAYLQTLSARNKELEAENERLRDKVDGLEADLDNAVETAFNRGAVQWTRLNYPKHYARLAALSAPKGGQDHG